MVISLDNLSFKSFIYFKYYHNIVYVIGKNVFPFLNLPLCLNDGVFCLTLFFNWYLTIVHTAYIVYNEYKILNLVLQEVADHNRFAIVVEIKAGLSWVNSHSNITCQ